MAQRVLRSTHGAGARPQGPGATSLPPVDELVRAGALIVGGRGRRAIADRVFDDQRSTSLIAMKGVGGMALLAAALFFLLPAGVRAGAGIGLVGILGTTIGFLKAAWPGLRESEPRWSPTELAELVGYVVATPNGEGRVTWLGETAAAAYLAYEPDVSDYNV